MVGIVMGVSGAGKTTVGERLAAELGWSFYDADAFHPPENVRRMQARQPLSDADREPWLVALEALVAALLQAGTPAVLACSALRAEYRERLARPAQGAAAAVRFVYLHISPDEAQRRTSRREGHFMPAALVESQFATLEPPAGALTLDATLPPADLVAAIRKAWGMTNSE